MIYEGPPVYIILRAGQFADGQGTPAYQLGVLVEDGVAAPVYEVAKHVKNDPTTLDGVQRRAVDARVRFPKGQSCPTRS